MVAQTPTTRPRITTHIHMLPLHMPENTQPLRIKSFTLGPFATNCHIVSTNDACWIIDAAYDPAPMIDDIRTRHLKPHALILTHAHADHIAGIDDLLHALGEMPILLHPAEADWLADPNLNLSASMGAPVRVLHPPTAFLEHDQSLDFAGTSWRVIHVPGHSPGGIALYHEPDEGPPLLIAGDALFAGSIGRTDFPTSDHDLLVRSIRQHLYTLPADTIVLPGHGPATTIDRERHSNPFVRSES